MVKMNWTNFHHHVKLLRKRSSGLIFILIVLINIGISSQQDAGSDYYRSSLRRTDQYQSAIIAPSAYQRYYQSPPVQGQESSLQYAPGRGSNRGATTSQQQSFLAFSREPLPPPRLPARSYQNQLSINSPIPPSGGGQRSRSILLPNFLSRQSPAAAPSSLIAAGSGSDVQYEYSEESEVPQYGSGRRPSNNTPLPALSRPSGRSVATASGSSRTNKFNQRPLDGLLRPSPSSPSIAPESSIPSTNNLNNSLRKSSSPTLSSKRPAILRGNNNRLNPSSSSTTAKSIEDLLRASPSSTSSSRPEVNSNLFLKSSHRLSPASPNNNDKELVRGSKTGANNKAPNESDDYTVEYVEYVETGDEDESEDKSQFEYYELSEETAAKVLGNKTKENGGSTNNRVKSYSESKRPNITISPSVHSSKEENKGQVVISVATTKSVGIKNSGQEETIQISTESPKKRISPTPSTRVTFSHVTDSSVVKASVQTSRSVSNSKRKSSRVSTAPPTAVSLIKATPSVSLSEGVKDSIPSGAENSPEYYEEEYSYPDNFPILVNEPEADKVKESGVGEVSSSTSTSTSVITSVNGGGDEEGEEHSNLNALRPSLSKERVYKKAQSFFQPLDYKEEPDKPLEDKPLEDKHLEDKEEEAKEEEEKTKEIEKKSILPRVPSFPIPGIKFAEISADLLPPGFAPPSPTSTSTTSTTTSTTTTTTTTTTTEAPKSTNDEDKIVFDELPSFLLPKGYKPLAPQIKDPPTTSTEKPGKIEIISVEDILKDLLPKDYKPFKIPSETPAPAPTKKTFGGIVFKEINIADLIPKDYKLPSSGEKKGEGQAIPKFVPVSILPKNLLPSNFSTGSGTNSSKTDDPSSTLSPLNLTTKKPSGLVYPTKAGGFRVTRPTTTEGPKADTPPPPKVNIGAGGWPTRKTTEFTGWPTVSTTRSLLPSTTPIPSTTATELSTQGTTPKPTTTTTPPPPKRSPLGRCPKEICRMEATIRITGGVEWRPELADVNTEDYKHLEITLKRTLDGIFRASGLAPWYKRVQIEGFNRGSVLVDYFVELEKVDRELTTADVVKAFHKKLLDSDPAGGDELEEGGENNNMAHFPSEASLTFGKFTIDPRYTDFSVVNKRTNNEAQSQPDGLIPPWAIAVVVLGVVSLLFVIILGTGVLINRRKNSKKKTSAGLTQDMLNQFNINNMGGRGAEKYGSDGLYNMDAVWNDEQTYRTFDRRPTKRSQGSSHGGMMEGGGLPPNYNIYDSWKTEWNGYSENSNRNSNHFVDAEYLPSRRRSDYDTDF